MKMEYKGGYARTIEIDALFQAKLKGLLNKNELRVFCARLESQESGQRVSVDWILNRKVKRRFTLGQQKRAASRLDKALKKHQSSKELTTKIPRGFLRYAARGKLNASEIWAGLLYFARRMPQRKRRECLVRAERYARFTLEIGKQITGIARSTLCEALRRLRAMKLISCVWRPMWEIKRFGLMYVDGPGISISYEKDERFRSRRKPPHLQNQGTQSANSRNAIKKTLPKNFFKAHESVFDTLNRLKQRFGMNGEHPCTA